MPPSTPPPDDAIPHQDFAILDRPDALSVMFYPRPDRRAGPPGARDLSVPVAADTAIHCRWHPLTPAAPAVLFFHGNGEVVADYDDIAGVYRHFGMSLFAAEYRGYGASTGRPSFGGMLADALTAADAFHETLDADGTTGPRFVMGRSLGALSAVEVAARRPQRFRGVILESGSAGVRGWQRFARPDDDPAAWDALREGQLAKLRAISLPLLTIHGEWDELIPLDTALEVQQVIGSAVKDLEVIPSAGHNDLMALGITQYFEALAAFVARHGAGAPQ
jgi:alpha-beta hydrolase superfamily lysophospholipase